MADLACAALGVTCWLCNRDRHFWSIAGTCFMAVLSVSFVGVLVIFLLQPWAWAWSLCAMACTALRLWYADKQSPATRARPNGQRRHAAT